MVVVRSVQLPKLKRIGFKYSPSWPQHSSKVSFYFGKFPESCQEDESNCESPLASVPLVKLTVTWTNSLQVKFIDFVWADWIDYGYPFMKRTKKGEGNLSKIYMIASQIPRTFPRRKMLSSWLILIVHMAMYSETQTEWGRSEQDPRNQVWLHSLLGGLGGLWMPVQWGKGRKSNPGALSRVSQLPWKTLSSLVGRDLYRKGWGTVTPNLCRCIFWLCPRMAKDSSQCANCKIT